MFIRRLRVNQSRITLAPRRFRRATVGLKIMDCRVTCSRNGNVRLGWSPQPRRYEISMAVGVVLQNKFSPNMDTNQNFDDIEAGPFVLAILCGG